MSQAKPTRVALIMARKANRLTQEQLAKKCEITRAYLTNIERGKHAPSLHTAFRLAKVLNCTLEQLFATDFTRRDQDE